MSSAESVLPEFSAPQARINAETEAPHPLLADGRGTGTWAEIDPTKSIRPLVQWTVFSVLHFSQTYRELLIPHSPVALFPLYVRAMVGSELPRA